MNTEHELEALKTEFAEYKTKQEADVKTEIDSLKELIRDLRGDVGEIMSMHDGQEEDLVELERSPTERVKRFPVTDRNR